MAKSASIKAAPRSDPLLFLFYNVGGWFLARVRTLLSLMVLAMEMREADLAMSSQGRSKGSIAAACSGKLEVKGLEWPKAGEGEKDLAFPSLHPVRNQSARPGGMTHAPRPLQFPSSRGAVTRFMVSSSP